MQQLYTRQLIFRVGCSSIIKRCNHNVKNVKNETVEHEQRDHALICPRWEEAIITEHRKSDVPFDMMQKNTIDMINNNTKQQPLPESTTKPSA